MDVGNVGMLYISIYGFFFSAFEAVCPVLFYAEVERQCDIYIPADDEVLLTVAVNPRAADQTNPGHALLSASFDPVQVSTSEIYT